MQQRAHIEDQTEVKKRHKILLVDDSRMVRASIIKAIRDHFDYREAADGEAAWEALLHDPTLEMVVTDVGMPRLDGYRLLERIRQAKLPNIRDLPIVVLSGDETAEGRARAKGLGANDFISKGMDSKEILDRIDGVFRLEQLKKEFFTQTSYGQTQLERTDFTGSSTEELKKDAFTTQMVENMATVINIREFMEGASSTSSPKETIHSAIVFVIDQFAALEMKYGAKLAFRLHKKFVNILISQSRKGEIVEYLDAGGVVLYSPNSDLIGRSAFSLRVCRAVEKLVMAYGRDRIRITVSVGVAGEEGIEGCTRAHLCAIAQDRALMARTDGGNRVYADTGEVGAKTMAELMKLPVSLDRMSIMLRAGALKEVLKNRESIESMLAPLVSFLNETADK